MKLLKILSLLLCLNGIVACSSVSYLMDAGIGQWRMLNRARPIEEVLNSTEVDEPTKSAIRLIQDAKAFSVQELKLKATSNYNTYVKLDGPSASYVVTASHPLKLEPKHWHFPIVGEIPYIGFFEEAKAKKFLEKLRDDHENWYTIQGKELPPDLNLRGASAYSTLGWLPDPLYSSMISASERRMVETVIHESVHATVFIGSNMDFNERLANFIGLEGSLLYMRKKYGAVHEKYLKSQAMLASEKIFAKFIDEITEEFRRTVEPEADRDVEKALAMKKAFYAGLPQRYAASQERWKNQWPDITPPHWNIDFGKWNNAVINGYRTYNADSGVFQEMLSRCEGDVKRLMLWIIDEYDKSKSKFRDGPDAYVQDMAKNRTCPP